MIIYIVTNIVSLHPLEQDFYLHFLARTHNSFVQLNLEPLRRLRNLDDNRKVTVSIMLCLAVFRTRLSLACATSQLR